MIKPYYYILKILIILTIKVNKLVKIRLALKNLQRKKYAKM